jgi:chorismate mutase
MVDNMIRRSRKRGNGRGSAESSSKAREEAMKKRLESISGYDFDEGTAKEVEERIRRMSYGHKVEK